MNLRTGTILRAWLLGALAHLLAGCAWTPVAPYEGAAPADATVYLILGGWHTEIGLPAEATGRFSAEGFPGARYLVFGWGELGYYTARDPGSGDALRALIPGPAVMLVIPLPASPAQQFGTENVLALPLSQPGLSRLIEYLEGYAAMESDGTLRRVGAGPESGSMFYASTGSYSVLRNCNTWTAEALHVAGLPIDARGVIFAGQVASQARPLVAGGR